ncbi:MAG: hypothetical protein M3R49_04715 [Chloroflexota bacterium]|nr:hypothetical protein [Chloroflexota bacterium]
MTRVNTAPPLDPRRSAAAARLRRVKSGIVGVAAALALGMWSFVTAALPSAAKVAPSPAPATFTAPADEGFFGNGSPQLGTSNNQTPVLRSRGS